MEKNSLGRGLKRIRWCQKEYLRVSKHVALTNALQTLNTLEVKEKGITDIKYSLGFLPMFFSEIFFSLWNVNHRRFAEEKYEMRRHGTILVSYNIKKYKDRFL